jgi:predicted Zn-dependent peptidase
MKFTNLYRAVAALALPLALSANALAQGPGGPQPQSTKGAVIKGRAPVNRDILKVKLPKPFETTLSNGLRVLVLENRKVPAFNMQMIIMSGGMNDSADSLGTAQFTASLLREGTKTRNSKQIAEETDALAATLSANAGLSSTTSTVNASGLTENFDAIMALFTDVLLNPSFPADELAKLKQRSLAGLRQQRANPGFLANEKLSQVMYGAHPAARSALNAEAINKITPEALARFHAMYYRPNNAMFAIVGDVRPSEVVAKLEKALAAWSKGDAPAANIPSVAETGASKVYLIDRPGSVQTNLLLGAQTVSRTDPDYVALQVMNKIVGGGGSARLFLNLREDKGYTYGAYSNFSAPKYRGTFVANTEVRTEVTDGSMKELFYEINRIRDEAVPAKELDDAKRAIVGGFALRLEQPQTILSNLVDVKLFGLAADYWDTYPAQISAVTAEDVQRVARKYLTLERMQIVAVGDAGKIAESLKKYGAVEVFDTEGRPVMAKKEMDKGEMSPAASAGFAGKWQLNISAPGQDLTGTMMLSKEGDNYKGAVNTHLGEAPLSNIKVDGNQMKADITVNAQGQEFAGRIVGALSEGGLKGEISLPGFPPIPFSGKRQ